MLVEEFLIRDNKNLRKAGFELAEAAIYVCKNCDGLHRLMLAIANWSKTIADEGGRKEMYEKVKWTASTEKEDCLKQRLMEAQSIIKYLLLKSEIYSSLIKQEDLDDMINYMLYTDSCGSHVTLTISKLNEFDVTN